MVLRNRVALDRLLVTLFMLATAFLFPEGNPSKYQISSLLQFGMWNANLLLLKDSETVRVKRPYYGVDHILTSEYTIRNDGPECTAKLGLLVMANSFWEDPVPTEETFLFRINGRRIFPVVERVEAPEDNNDRHPSQGYGGYGDRLGFYRIAIDAEFPAGEETAVLVQYRNSSVEKAHNQYRHIGGISAIGYNCFEFLDYTNLSRWEGEPELVLTIINESEGGEDAESNIERFWIADIQFSSFMYSEGDGIFRMCYYLMDTNDIRTDVISLWREAENMFTVTFSREFVARYGRNFFVALMLWTSLPSYCNILSPPYSSCVLLNIFPITDRSAGLISERELGPYELFFLTARQLRVMRNAFYARHGYVFRSQDLRDLFFSDLNADLDAGKGYVPNPDFSESMLTDIDRANIRTIQRLEMMDRGP